MGKKIKLKLIVLGDTYCGKSSILTRYKNNNFSESGSSTIGVDFFNIPLHKNNTEYILHVWDTSGQEKFNSIISSYYRNIAVAILIFDLSRKETFTNLSKWLDNIKHYCQKNTIIKLIGNKCDIASVITKHEINNLCYDYNITYLEASAKLNYNIETIFTTIIEEIDDKLNNCIIIPNNNNGILLSDSFDMEVKKISKNEPKCCIIL